VIIRDGRIVNETEIADLTANRVIVRVDCIDPMLSARRTVGVSHDLLAEPRAVAISVAAVVAILVALAVGAR